MGFFEKFVKAVMVNTAKNMIKDSKRAVNNNLPKHAEEEEYKTLVFSQNKYELDKTTIDALKKRFIAFDLETTGFSPCNDRIVEIGAHIFENGVVVESFSSLINPGMHIPKSASAVNHITDAMVSNELTEDVVLDDFVLFLGDALYEGTYLCAHNASFDIKFISEALSRNHISANINYVDTLNLSRKTINLDNYKLGNIAEYFGIMQESEHRAADDALVCGKILCQLIAEKEKQLAKDLEYHEEWKFRMTKNVITKEELVLCAYIQKILLVNGCDSKWLCFYKNSNNYVIGRCYLDPFKFKFTKKGTYIVVDNYATENLNLQVAPCTKSEGGDKNTRVFINSINDLDCLASYIVDKYKSCEVVLSERFDKHSNEKNFYLEELSLLKTFTSEDIDELLKDINCWQPFC